MGLLAMSGGIAATRDTCFWLAEMSDDCADQTWQ